MDVIEHNFWFVAGIVAALNVALCRRRLRAVIALGRVSEAEADAFFRNALISIGIVTAALGAISLAFSVSPRCMQPYNFERPPSIATTVVFLVAWAGLLRWVWGRGGELVARAPSAFITQTSHETQFEPLSVRIVVTCLVVFSAVVVPFLASGMPAPPGCAG